MDCRWQRSVVNKEQAMPYFISGVRKKRKLLEDCSRLFKIGASRGNIQTDWLRFFLSRFEKEGIMKE